MSGENYSEIEVAELKHKLDGGAAIWVSDVRNGDEFAGESGHIPSALNVPYAEMPAILEAIAEAKDPIRMAAAMKHAVAAGRHAYLAGRMPKKLYADPSSPLGGLM